MNIGFSMLARCSESERHSETRGRGQRHGDVRQRHGDGEIVSDRGTHMTADSGDGSFVRDKGTHITD